MHTFLRRIGISLLALMVPFAFALAAQADGGFKDRISDQDRQVYQNLNFQNRFGVQFRSHRQVCADAGPGEVHCNARVVTDDQGTPLVKSAAIAGFGATQFLKAYGLTGVASGHPVIAIVDAYDDPNIVNDLKTYSTAFGLPQLPTCSGAIASSAVPCFKKVNQTGGSTPPPANAGWSLEIALDVEVAHATCQNCGILLVEANSATYANLMAAVDHAVQLGAKVVSNSYGGAEFSGETAYDSHFNHPGVAFTVSAGDSGYGVEYPAASKYVTAVGGDEPVPQCRRLVQAGARLGRNGERLLDRGREAVVAEGIRAARNARSRMSLLTPIRTPVLPCTIPSATPGRAAGSRWAGRRLRRRLRPRSTRSRGTSRRRPLKIRFRTATPRH